MTNKVLEAIKYADAKHKGQVRKVSNSPYIEHPLKVSYLLMVYKESHAIEDLLCACLLHDVIEDTNAKIPDILNKFGANVLGIVCELTNDDKMIEKLGKLEYHKKKLVGLSSWALTIKLVDRLANITDNPSDKMKKETKELINYLMAKRTLTKTQMKICHDILKEINL